MRVHFATGIGIGLGFLIGAIALGWIKTGQQTQLNAQTGNVTLTFGQPISSGCNKPFGGKR